MKIPRESETKRFYVVTSDKHAFASWTTLEEAEACIRRFAIFYSENYECIIGIVEISGSSKVFHSKKKMKQTNLTNEGNSRDDRRR